MKKILSILLMLIYATTNATTYQVGSDATYHQYSDIPALSAGDVVQFKKGESFNSFTISASGSVGNYITIASYGAGANPIITGFTTISGWTNEGGGIYSKVIASESQTNIVTVDGVVYGMGRYPNSTYLTYEGVSTNVSITDNELGTSTIWTGAEAVIRKNDWSLDRCIITNHTSNTLTYTSTGSSWSGTAGYGYFIQNDLRTLDQYGEWYHDYSGTGKFYMYFGAIDPTTKVVKVATVNTLITLTGSYIEINGLSITGSISHAIYGTNASASYNSIINCSVSNSGEIGMYLNASHITVDNNIVSYCGTRGIQFTNDYADITNNIISHIGIVKGLGKIASTGISSNVNSHVLIQYNDISYCGYNGMFMNGNYVSILNNFVNYTNLFLADGAGIYTDGIDQVSFIIDGNIVLNSVGNYDGTNHTNTIAEGIYLDEYGNNMTVQNNTVANCGYSGIKLHKAHDNLINNNVCFNNTWSGIYILNSSSTTSPIINNVVTNNIVIAKNTQYTLFCRSASNDLINFISTASGNVYGRPIADNTTIRLYQPSLGWLDQTLAQWVTYSGEDATSTISPFTVDDDNKLYLAYNATKVTTDVALPFQGKEIDGTNHESTITLAPYASAVLFYTADLPIPPDVLTPLTKPLMYKGKYLRKNGIYLKR